MGFTRFHSWTCDVSDCSKTVVFEYPEGITIPEGAPPSWHKVEENGQIKYVCIKCALKYGGEFLKKLYPISYIISSDPGAKGGDKIAQTLINAHAVSISDHIPQVYNRPNLRPTP